MAVAYLYRQAVSHQTALLRDHVSDLAQIVAASLDVDRHEQLVRPQQQDSELYRDLLAPLKAFHLRHHSVVYAYTIRVSDDGRENVILDSTTDPEVQRHELADGRTAIPSPLLEEYHTPDDHNHADRILRSGQPYVFEIPYIDDFGTFINARYPLLDSSGAYVGYAGIHYSLSSFEHRITEVRVAGLVTLAIAIFISLILAQTAGRVRQQNLKQIAQIAATEADMASFNMVFQYPDGSTQPYPFWNEINGPISDALWHTGQIVSFRRSSGNPFPSNISVLQGTVRE